MDKEVIFALTFSIILGSISIIALLMRSNFINFVTKFFIINKKNSLSFFKQYEVSSDYSTYNRFRRIGIKKIIKKFKKHTTSSFRVNVRVKFNNFYYPIHDLDVKENLELFKKIYAGTPYVLFQSSKDRYWGIVDVPYKKKSHIIYDHNWNICNDPKFVDYAKHHKILVIRGLYKNIERKPVHVYTNKKLSKNFQLFVDKLVTYYNKEGLELSVLKFKDPNLLMIFNRKRKLKILNKKNN